MSKIIEEIKNPIREELQLFEEKFRDSLQSSVPLLDKITRFIVKTKGKQIRPITTFLCAKLVGEINDKTFRGASIIELIHTATLIHDDVVDDSQMRRSFFSINALWKNKIAVLVGDYLLSKSVILSTENNDADLLGVVSRTIKEMSEGELLQLEKARKLDITEEIYFDIIRKKTASLLSACCEIGAISAGATPEMVEKMRYFGNNAGLAFQMRDDIFDYLETNIIGKPTANDIKEQKMTLPLIFALKNATEKEKKYFFNIVKNQNKDTEKVKELIDFVKAKGGIEYATKVMEERQQRASAILETFPNNEAKKSLQLLLNYIIKRKF